MTDQDAPLNFSFRHLTQPSSPAGSLKRSAKEETEESKPKKEMGFVDEVEPAPASSSRSPSRASAGDRGGSSSPEDSPLDPQLNAALTAMLGSASPFLQGTPSQFPTSHYSQLFGNSVPFFNQASYMQSIAAMSAAVNAAVYGQKNANSFDGTTVSVNSFNVSNSPRSRSPTPVNSNAQLSCAVCGDVSSGKHYGILACNGCSGFFKRSVRRRLIYRCQAGTGSCVVDKAHRNQCQACRLKKCLALAVQNERQPRNTATVQNGEAELYHANFLRDCSSVLSSTLDLNNVSLDLHALERKNSLESELKELSATSNPEVSSRLLFMAVKWAKALPSFAQLNTSDQNCWAELFLLSGFQWSMEMEKCPLFEGIEQSELILPLIHLFEQFKTKTPDQGEFACLKAIVLFRPGLRNSSQVERLQDQAQMMLHQHTNRDPNSNRFGRLLLLLPTLRTVSVPKLLEVVFLQSALGGKSVMSLINDINKV